MLELIHQYVQLILWDSEKIEFYNFLILPGLLACALLITTGVLKRHLVLLFSTPRCHPLCGFPGKRHKNSMGLETSSALQDRPNTA